MIKHTNDVLNVSGPQRSRSKSRRRQSAHSTTSSYNSIGSSRRAYAETHLHRLTMDPKQTIEDFYTIMDHAVYELRRLGGAFTDEQHINLLERAATKYWRLQIQLRKRSARSVDELYMLLKQQAQLERPFWPFGEPIRKPLAPPPALPSPPQDARTRDGGVPGPTRRSCSPVHARGGVPVALRRARC